jgi:dTDP-L-rhamnose 4-epimerase
MRALITGGAGFIGSHLADRLLREGFWVRVLDTLDEKIHPGGKPAYLPTEVDFVQGSVTDVQAVEFALRDIDVVFHEAAYQDYMPDFSRFLHVNAVGTALLYETIVRHRLPIKKVIVASSQAIYGEGQYVCALHGVFAAVPRTQRQMSMGDWEVACPECGKSAQRRLLDEGQPNPYNQYAVSKLAQEKSALGLGWLFEIPTVALRYSITQGPRQSLHNHYSGICRIFFSRALNHDPLIVYEDGKQSRDFVHVEDVVGANILALVNASADFEAFNVGSGQPKTVLEYAESVLQLLQSSSSIQVRGEYRRGDSRHSVSDIQKLGRLGWRPRKSFSDILSDFLAWIESIGGIPRNIPDAYVDMKMQGVVRASVPS